jgi:signal transduction histidine kinase
MSPAELARALRRNDGCMRRARAAGPFEAVAEVVDFGRHVPSHDRYNSTNYYVYIVLRNSIVSIRSTPVSLLTEAGRMMRSLLNYLLDMSRIEARCVGEDVQTRLHRLDPGGLTKLIYGV